MHKISDDSVGGCPLTEMRSKQGEFEAWILDNGLHYDLHMIKNAPYYSNPATRILFFQLQKAGALVYHE